MIAKKSTKRVFGLISAALVASILMQWLIIPKIQWNNGVLADGAWNPNNQDSASSVNYAKILGGALDYGIVANEINQLGHMETTFATNNFINSAGANNDIDFLDYDKTAHFIIANWQDDIVFGNTTAANFYIEGPSSLFDDFDPTSDDRENGNFYLDSNFFSFRNSIPSGQDFPPIPESPMPTPAIIEHVTSNLPNGTNANVNRLINRISEETDGWSDRLHSRATSAAYNLPSSYISNPTSNSILIDITDPIFDNRVVYVNVTSEMMQNIFRGGAVDAEGNPTQGLVIKKNASSVIVFNIEDDVCGDAALTTANFIVLSGNNRMGSTTNTNGNRTPYREGGSNVGSHVIDTELCRTVVWNIRTDNDVNLDSLAGTILIPQPVNVTISSGNCAGWLVTSGTVNVEKEFHYIYAGNSSDGHNQMHFASYKAFTTQYADKNDVLQYEVTSIDINSGDYRFNWAEYTDGTWSSVVDGTARTISADTTGDIEFPVQTFYTDDAHIGDPHYVQPGDSEDFYYRVTEIPGTVPGVSYSNGFINIRLKVESDADGNLSYFVQSYTQNGDGSDYSRNGTWDGDDDSDWVPMAGVRFDLGGFYNEVDTNSLVITKTVGGDYNTVVDDTFSFYVYSVDTSGARTYYKENGESNGSTAYPIDVTFTVAGAVTASTLITGLPDGEYFVEEVGSSAERTGYVLDSGSHSTSVIVSSDTFSQANITNTYSKFYNLEVTKTVTGSGAASISSDDFSFYIKTQSGDQYVQENGELGSQPHYFSVAAGETVRLSNVPAGQYVVVEDLANAEAHATGTVVFDEDSSTTNPSIEVYTDSTANAELINNYIDNSVGTLTISKTTVGATYVDTNPSNAFEFRVSYVDNGTTYYVHLDNGVYVADQWNPYATLTVMPGSSINITGDFVVVGRVFHVEELNYDTKTESWRFVDGLPHTYSTTAINGTECTATDVEIISGNNSLCDVVNYFDGIAPAEGSIEINKTISLDSRVSLTDIGTITFEVRNGSTVVETINLDPNNLGSGWTKTGDVYSYTVTGLTAGTEYTVVETSTGEQGTVVLDTTASDTSNKTPTASDATTLPDSAKASFTNAYTSTTVTYGYIQVVKTLSGISLDLAGDINFTVTGVDGITIPTLNREAVRTGVWTENGSTYTYVIPTAIATGTDVTVSESDPT
ncbi:MAG: hypothetical protein IKP14_09265, partial [Clostridiales bacterium]|nr:hypothetical protein [Clostridiales bacterium]